MLDIHVAAPLTTLVLPLGEIKHPLLCGSTNSTVRSSKANSSHQVGEASHRIPGQYPKEDDQPTSSTSASSEASAEAAAHCLAGSRLHPSKKRRIDSLSDGIQSFNAHDATASKTRQYYHCVTADADGQDVDIVSSSQPPGSTSTLSNNACPHILMDLPEELLDNIIAFLPGSDRKCIRLTCSRLCAIANHYMWTRLYISSNQLDLDVFQRITSHPTFARNVKEIVWDDTTFQRGLEKWPDFKAVAEHGFPLRVRLLGRWIRYIKCDQKLHDLWCSLAQAHHRNREAGLDLEILRQALPNLPSVRSIILSGCGPDRSVDNEGGPGFNESPFYKAWNNLEQVSDYTLGPPPNVCWYEDAFGLRAGRWDGPNRLLWELENVSDIRYLEDALPHLDFEGALDNFRPLRGLLALIRTMSVTQTRILHFSMIGHEDRHDVRLQGFPYYFFHHWRPDLELMCAFGANLRSLNLAIANSDGSDGLRMFRTWCPYLHRVLSHFQCLESLGLSTEGAMMLCNEPGLASAEAGGAIKYGLIDPRHHWPKLSHLSLTHVGMHEEALLTFLMTHRASLRSIRFERCWLQPRKKPEDLDDDELAPEDEQSDWRSLLARCITAQLTSYSRFNLISCSQVSPKGELGHPLWLLEDDDCLPILRGKKSLPESIIFEMEYYNNLDAEYGDYDEDFIDDLESDYDDNDDDDVEYDLDEEEDEYQGESAEFAIGDLMLYFDGRESETESPDQTT